MNGESSINFTSDSASWYERGGAGGNTLAPIGRSATQGAEYSKLGRHDTLLYTSLETTHVIGRSKTTSGASSTQCAHPCFRRNGTSPGMDLPYLFIYLYLDTVQQRCSPQSPPSGLSPPGDLVVKKNRVYICFYFPLLS